MIFQRLHCFSPVITRSLSNLPPNPMLTLISRRTLSMAQSQRIPLALGSWRQKSRQDVSYLQSNSLPGMPLYNNQSLRFYRRKKTVRILPKPITFDYSGDLRTTLPAINPEAPKPGYEDVEELKSAEKSIKDIFSLGFADGAQIREKRLNDLLSVIKEHPADVQSLEVKIASTTLLLRNQMRHVKDSRKDKVAKSMLIKRIHRRNRDLRLLRTRDMEKFEWLLKELKIKYIPEKTYKDHHKLSKRAMRKKVARDGYLSVKKQKLEQLRQRLAVERELFEKEKNAGLSRIAWELEAMGIHEMESVDSVLAAMGMHKYIEKPEKRMKRRYLILERKFELHAAREKAKKEAAQSEF